MMESVDILGTEYKILIGDEKDFPALTDNE